MRLSISPLLIKSRSRRTIWPARMACCCCFVERFSDHRQSSCIGLVLKKIAGAFAVGGYGGERLVELVRQR